MPKHSVVSIIRYTHNSSHQMSVRTYVPDTSLLRHAESVGTTQNNPWARVREAESKITALETRLQTRIDDLNTEFDSRLSLVEENLTGNLTSKIGELETEIDTRMKRAELNITALEEKVDTQGKDLKATIIGISVERLKQINNLATIVNNIKDQHASVLEVQDAINSKIREQKESFATFRSELSPKLDEHADVPGEPEEVSEHPGTSQASPLSTPRKHRIVPLPP